MTIPRSVVLVGVGKDIQNAHKDKVGPLIYIVLL